MTNTTYTTQNYNGNLIKCMSAFEVVGPCGNRINWFWEKEWAIEFAREIKGAIVRIIPDVDKGSRNEDGVIVRFANVWD